MGIHLLIALNPPMLIALLSSTPLHAVNRGGAVSSARVDSKASRAQHRAGAHDDASFKVCVVGAGPCGLLFSNALLRQNADAVVEIFEQAPKGGRPHDGNSGFGLGKRACDAIDEVPGLLSEVESVGTYAYLSKARPGQAPLRTKDGLLRLSRKKLTSVMLRRLKAEHGSRVRETFGAQCGEIDFGERLLNVRLRRGGTRRVAYDLLVGADGVNSQVRQQLVARGDVRVAHYVRPRANGRHDRPGCLSLTL